MKENLHVGYEPFQLYLKGFLRSFGLALILIVVMTTAFFFIDLNNNLVGPLEFIILLLSVLYASIFVSRRMDNKGWMHGLIVGTVYFVILLIINFVTSIGDFHFFTFLPKWIFFASTGLLGGTIGINLR